MVHSTGDGLDLPGRPTFPYGGTVTPTRPAAIRSTFVPAWVRWGTLATLAVPQLGTGLWAVLAPHHWYENFPGVGSAIVAADPPYNAHLATDAGAGFFATGVALAVVAVWARRDLMRIALVTFLAFSVPHVMFHIAHSAPSLSTAVKARSVAMLAFSVGLGCVFLWGTFRERGAPSASSPTR